MISTFGYSQDELLTELKFFQRIFKQNGCSNRQAHHVQRIILCTSFFFFFFFFFFSSSSSSSSLDGTGSLVCAHSKLTNSEI
jgi:hypothetical protein